MHDISPLWQDDEGSEEVPVHAKSVESTPATPQVQNVSRRPAALVGMTAVIAIGAVFFGGVSNLTGQLANNTASVRITESGFEPSVLEVEHGTTITWTNEAELPHVLESGTLCSDTGYCLQSNTMFKGDTENFSITPDMQAGTYEYRSSLSDAMIGQIIITTQAVEDFQDMQNVFSDDFFDTFGSDPVGTTTPPPSGTPPPAPQPQPDFSVGQGPNIPSNPYTVDSERIHPFDSGGDPIPEAFGDAPNTTPTAQLGGARVPLRQPETGPGVWIVIIASVGSLWLLTKDMFATIER